MEKRELLYEGKAKQLFATDDASLLVQHFKDDATAFDGKKKDSIKGKGDLNCSISTVLFEYLASYHIPNHFIKRLSPTEMLVKRVQIIPIEVVMRNVATGSLVRRLPFEEGQKLVYPIFELYLKDDARNDPLINEYHAYALNLCKSEELKAIFRVTAKVNAVLRAYFDRRGMTLVDFKLEFGRYGNDLIVADEISPDTCRIWDQKSGTKLDKDRFRQDLGGLTDAYREVFERISNN